MQDGQRDQSSQTLSTDVSVTSAYENHSKQTVPQTLNASKRHNAHPTLGMIYHTHSVQLEIDWTDGVVRCFYEVWRLRRLRIVRKDSFGQRSLTGS